jgi:hypothetical protein
MQYLLIRTISNYIVNSVELIHPLYQYQPQYLKEKNQKKSSISSASGILKQQMISNKYQELMETFINLV